MLLASTLSKSSVGYFSVKDCFSAENSSFIACSSSIDRCFMLFITLLILFANANRIADENAVSNVVATIPL